MKMKKASEMTRLPAASQLLTVAAFSRDWAEEDGEDFCSGEDSAALCAGGTAEAAVATWFVLASSSIMSSIATLAEKRKAR